MDIKTLASMIDHTLLSPEANRAAMEAHCSDAAKYGFCTVAIHPYHVEFAAKLLRGTGVKVCSVTGFPTGNNLTPAKVLEAQLSLDRGAEEIDMVIALPAVKDGLWDYVTEDIAAVAKACGKAPLKVIFETCLLTDEEKKRACKACFDGGAAFVKTSTGLSKWGATVEDVRLMKAEVGDRLLVKAAGGIRDYNTAVAMVEAGASRLGTSAGVAIVTGGQGSGSY